MTKFTAIFKNGTALVFTDDRFANRLDVYNHICLNRLGKGRGGLVEIQETGYLDSIREVSNGRF